MGAFCYILGELGGHGGPLGDVWKRPEGVQSHFKIIEKTIVFIAFLSIEVILKVSEVSWAALWGP